MPLPVLCVMCYVLYISVCDMCAIRGCFTRIANLSDFECMVRTGFSDDFVCLQTKSLAIYLPLRFGRPTRVVRLRWPFGLGAHLWQYALGRRLQCRNCEQIAAMYRSVLHWTGMRWLKMKASWSIRWTHSHNDGSMKARLDGT